MTTPVNEILVQRPITARELEAIAAVAQYGDQRIAAKALGVAVQTVKNQCSRVYLKLEVDGMVQAFRALGWLRLPTEEELSVIATEDAVTRLTMRLEAMREQVDALLAEIKTVPGSHSSSGLIDESRITDRSVSVSSAMIRHGQLQEAS